MDEDLQTMSPEQLVEEVKKLRQGIRKHRDCSGHDLYWFHPDLWKGAYASANRWTSNCPRRHVSMRNLKNSG